MFLTDDFISSISNKIPTVYYSLDIRRMISSQLELLSLFCRSSQIVVTDTMNILLSNQLLISKMVGREAINSQIDILFNEAKKDVTVKQKLYGEYIRTSFQIDLLFSALSNDILYMNVDDNYRGFYSIK